LFEPVDLALDGGQRCSEPFGEMGEGLLLIRRQEDGGRRGGAAVLTSRNTPCAIREWAEVSHP
jgi:hypothetical protein